MTQRKRICLPMQKTQEMWVWSLGREDPLEEGIATHSSTLAWEIPWTEEPGGLQSMGLQSVGHDWMTSVFISSLCKSKIRNLWNSARNVRKTRDCTEKTVIWPLILGKVSFSLFIVSEPGGYHFHLPLHRKEHRASNSQDFLLPQKMHNTLYLHSTRASFNL